MFEAITNDEAEPDSRAVINLVFTSDRRLRTLNQTFRRKDAATDVLSFNLDTSKEPSSTFGEIYISVPTADRQAAAYGASRSEEYLRLVCHGLLHLFGYDHTRRADAIEMKRREQLYLAMAMEG